MKKWLSLLCALIMVLSMLPAAIASADEMVTIKYVIPGSEKEDYATVIEAVNAKLAADLGIQVELVYIPWDVWDQKLNLMLSTGEEFDLFHVMQDRVSFATYYSRGGLADITDAHQLSYDSNQGVLLLWRHAENINRLLAGKESKLGAKKA